MPTNLPAASVSNSTEVFSVRRKGFKGFLKVKAKFPDLQKAVYGKPALIICSKVLGSVELFVQILLERDLSSPQCFQHLGSLPNT